MILACMLYNEQKGTKATAYSLSCTKDCLDKPAQCEYLRELERVSRKAPSNGLLTDAKHTFCTLEGSVHTFF